MNREEIDEIKRHFDVVSQGMRSELRLAVETLDSKIERNVETLRTEMREGFAEVRR